MALGFILGFSISRGIVCTYVATRELVANQQPARLIALIEGAAWAGLIYAVLGASPSLPNGWLPFGYLIAGAVLFALGTYINGACIFGSVAHLGGGNLEFALVFVGVFAISFLNRFAQLLPAHPPQSLALPAGGSVFFAVLLVLIGIRYLVTRPEQRNFLRLTMVMATTALTTTILAILLPRFSITTTIEHLLVVPLSGGAVAVGMYLGSLFAPRLHGQRFKLTAPSWTGAIRRLTGGLLIGVGAALIPGGNDTLLLIGLPAVALQALIAYTILIVALSALIAINRRAADKRTG